MPRSKQPKDDEVPPLQQALEWIAQHRTGVIIMVVVMFVTLWLKNRR